MKHLSKGFTLIELMIVLAIIAILVSVAYPSYQEQVREARRADAKATLVELAQFMERNFTEANRYDQDAAGAATTLPFTQAPKDGNTKYYDLALSNLSATGFTLTATPKGAQTSDTKCKTFSLTQTGAKAYTGSGTVADCW